MDYPNKKDISFIDIYDNEVATYPRAVTYTGTVSTDSQDSKVLIADSDGDGFTTNFVEFGNNVAGFEEIRKGYYLFDGTEIRKVVGVTPSAQAITLDSPFTTSYEGLPLKVIKPILLPRVTFQNTGAVDGSIYTKTSPTDQTQYGSITLKAGDGYTFDSSTLSAFVIDSKNTTVKLSNAFFFEVGASGSGGLESVIAGDNITIDNTDPLNPIISVQDITLSGEVTGSTSLSAIDKTAITNKTTETIVGTDYVLFGDTSDSNNLKKGLISDIVALVSGTALSSITAATATNTINNVANTQEWQWNSLTSGTGLKLSSTSTSATTGNTLLELNSSGTIGNSVSSYGLKVANSKVSTPGINYGIDINVGGSSDNIGLNITATSGTKTTGINLVAGMVEGIQMNNNTLYFSSTNTQYISHTIGDINFEAGTKQLFFRNTGTTGRWCWFGNYQSYNNYTTLNRHTSNGTMLIFGGEWDGTTTISNTATPSLIKASSGGLTFSSNSGASTTWGSFTPNNQMTIYNVNNNVGIGTTTPVESASLEISSTTKGFLPPRMTAIQASAIASPAKSLIVYVTDTNGTFTSAGIWIYTTSWKLILAE